MIDALYRLLSEKASQEGAERDITTQMPQGANRARLALLLQKNRAGGLQMGDQLREALLASEGLKTPDYIR